MNRIKDDLYQSWSSNWLFLKENKAIATAAVKKSGHALRFLPSRLRANKLLVEHAVSQTGHALQYTSQQLRTITSLTELQKNLVFDVS